jgi:hypothetical protein
MHFTLHVWHTNARNIGVVLQLIASQHSYKANLFVLRITRIVVTSQSAASFPDYQRWHPHLLNGTVASDASQSDAGRIQHLHDLFRHIPDILGTTKVGRLGLTVEILVTVPRPKRQHALLVMLFWTRPTVALLRVQFAVSLSPT